MEEAREAISVHEELWKFLSEPNEEFPDKPKGMHWRTYERLGRAHDAGGERSPVGLMEFIMPPTGRCPALNYRPKIHQLKNPRKKLNEIKLEF